MYQTEHDELFASIREGKPFNDGEKAAQFDGCYFRWMVAFGQKITYQQALNSKEDLPRLTTIGKSLDVPMPPTPGITRFI